LGTSRNFASWGRRVALGVALALCAAPAALAEAGKFALVVGNESYAPDVGNATGAVAGARQVAAALSAAGFAVDPIENVSRGTLDAALRATAAKAKAAGACTLAFYYAGHAAVVAPDRADANAVILKGADARDASALLQDSERIDDVIAALTGAGCSGGAYVAIDGARANLAAGLGGSVTRGMGDLQDHRGAAVLFTAALGATAAPDSLFAQALSEALATPDQTMSAVFKAVVRRLADETARLRVPYLSDDVFDPACVTCGRLAPTPAVVPPSAAVTPYKFRGLLGFVRGGGDPNKFAAALGQFDSQNLGATIVAVGRGALAATGYSDGAIDIWDANTGKLVSTLSGDGQAVRALAWSADGTLLAASSLKGPVQLISGTGAKIRDISIVDASIAALGFSADGKGVLVASGVMAYRFPLDGGAPTWALQIIVPLKESSAEEIAGSFVAKSVWVGERMIWVSQDGRINSAADGQKTVTRATVRAPCAASVGRCQPVAIAASPDGADIAMARAGGVVQFFDAQGRPATDRSVSGCSAPGPSCDLGALAWLGGVGGFVSLSLNGEIAAWRADGGGLLARNGPGRLVGAAITSFEVNGEQRVVLTSYQGVSAVLALERVAP
jgi:hypothetical protein